LLQSNTTIAVKSAFDLTERQKQKIESPVKVLLGNNIAFNFSTVPELVSGIELSANGYKLTWSISEYLDSIKKVISESVKEKSEKSSGPELEQYGGN
jgi:F-type H+-transporting ATPase subunit b